MFMSCPHCRELVVTDRETRLPPPMCPRCGGELRERTDDDAVAPEDTASHRDAPTATPSIATFLQAGKDAEPDAATDASIATPGTPPDAAEAGASPHDTRVDATATNESERPETHADTLAATAASNAAAGEDGNGDPIAEPFEHAGMATAPDDAPRDLPALPAQPPSTRAASTAAVGPSHADTPSFIRQTTAVAARPRTATWQWALLALLSLLLLLQILIADRARLAADEHWRPIIMRLCGALGCDVPAWHQPGAFAMLSRDVRPIVGTPGGLHVQATFRNDAAWTQDWPLLQLSLSDADGRVVGMRAFTPLEYLGKSATPAGLAPGQSARIALQLHEPNPDVVAFSFDFR